MDVKDLVSVRLAKSTSHALVSSDSGRHQSPYAVWMLCDGEDMERTSPSGLKDCKLDEDIHDRRSPKGPSPSRALGNPSTRNWSYGRTDQWSQRVDRKRCSTFISKPDIAKHASSNLILLVGIGVKDG